METLKQKLEHYNSGIENAESDNELIRLRSERLDIFIRLRMPEAADEIQDLLKILDDKGDIVSVHKILHKKARFLNKIRKFDEAFKILENVISYFEKNNYDKLLQEALLSKSLNLIYPSNDAIILLNKIIEEYYDDDEICMKAYCNLGFRYKVLGKNIESLEYFIKSRLLAEKLNDKEYLSNLYPVMADNEAARGNIKTAIEYSSIAEKICLAEGDNFTLARLYNLKGNLYFHRNLLSEALSSYYESHRLFRQVSDEDGEGAVLNNMGLVYERMKNYSQAIEHYRQAKKLFKRENNLFFLSNSLVNIGTIYLTENNYKVAYKYLHKGMLLKEEIQDHVHLMKSYKGLIKWHLNQNLTNGAQELIKKAEIEFHKTDYIDNKVIYHEQVAACHTALKQYDKAFKHYEKAKELATDAELKESLKDIYLDLYNLYKETNNFKEALEYHEKYKKLEDDIFNENNLNKINTLKTIAEIEQKEKENEIQRLKNVELKNAYENLKSAQEELIRKERMAAIGKIASDIAHEVQNPLNFVNNFSEITLEIVNELRTLLKSKNLSEDETELFENLIRNSLSVSDNGKRASGIVSQLLELTRKGVI